MRSEMLAQKNEHLHHAPSIQQVSVLCIVHSFDVCGEDGRRTTMTHLLHLLLLFLSSSSLIINYTDAAADTANSFFSTISDAAKQPYTTWLTTDNAASYDRSIFLSTTADPTKGMATFWKIAVMTFM
eukprot:scaffold2141_cov223-Skeletonema_dohrnii-CCMP3373.AAC.1